MGTYFVIGAVVLLLVIILIAVIRIRSEFIMLHGRVKNQMTQIEAQLKQHYDLIPNLLGAAKGYANFERDILEAVVKARQSVTEAAGFNQTAAINGKLRVALGRLLMMSESHPELKTDGSLPQLQRGLADTESKISVTWWFYDDIVFKYNNAIRLFPASLVAGLCDFSPMPF